MWNLIYPSIQFVAEFIKDNFVAIITTVVVISVCTLAFYATLGSLKKLKMSAFPYYPFGLFFPNAGGWSVGYFLIVVLFLLALVFLMAKGNFFLPPA